MHRFAIALFPALLFAQASASFEVASIKPSDAVKNAGMAWGWSLSYSDNGITTTGSLQSFIKYAWGIESLQISGGPAWLDRDIFEIKAKAAGRAGADQLRLMTQKLLIERFQLTLHRESRLLPVYALTLAKGGSKLRRDDFGGTSFSGGATLLRGTMDTAEIARHLTSTLHRVVIDNTGLQGTWKFDLTWAPDDATNGPSLFTAIQEQLGLKLESTKAPVEVLVIDHADKPPEN